MTVESVTNRIVHDTDGIQRLFPFDFVIDTLEECNVYLDGDIQPTGDWTIDPQYLGQDAGGDLEYVTLDPPADGQQLTIERIVVIKQQVAYPPFGPFPAASHEAALDRLTKIAQQHEDQIRRSLKADESVPPGSDYRFPPPLPNAGLYWNDDGTSFVNGPTAQTIETDRAAAEQAAIDSQNSAAASATSANDSQVSADASAASAVESAGYAQDTADLLSNAAVAVPGQVLYFPGLTEPPANYGLEKAQGQLLPREVYTVLWALVEPSAISDVDWVTKSNGGANGVQYYSAGDGSTTFRMPDLRGEFLRAWDDGAARNPDGDSQDWQPDDNKAHTHGYDKSTGTVQFSINDIALPVNQTAQQTAPSGGAEARPRNLSVLVCIKAVAGATSVESRLFHEQMEQMRFDWAQFRDANPGLNYP